MKSDSLYRLINSMDKGELRYCKEALLHDTTVLGQDRVALMEILYSMAEYSNDALKLAVADRVIGKNLAVEKARLFNQLLVHVGALHDTRPTANDPYKKLKEGKLLLEMWMLEEAEEAVLKGLYTAVRAEELFVEVQLREVLRTVYKNMGSRKIIDRQTENDYLLETASSKLATLIRYTHIGDRAFDYLRKYRVTDAEGVKLGMQELMDRPEMKDIKMANSLPSQLRYYSIWSFYHSSLGRLDLAIKSLQNALQLCESNPTRSALDPMSHISIVTNIIGKLNVIGKLNEVPMYLEKLQHIEVSGRRAEVFKFSVVELQYQLYYMNSGQLNIALEREPIIISGLKNYGKQLQDGPKLAFLYNLGVTHLVCNNTKQALAHFNRIQSMGRLAARADLQGVARLLRLLLLSDRKNNAEIDYFLRNSKRFFRTKDRGYKLEETVYSWLNKHNKIVGAAERGESISNFSQLVEPLMKKGVMGAEEMFIWSSAISRRVSPMVVFKERLAAQSN